MKYEKWSLGYWCLKQYIKFADWFIYKKTIVTGREKIPTKKPIVFAPNHQNALSDPMAVLLNTRFQPVWLARADIFKKGIITTILRFLKIMPVYRIRDGKENLSKNDKTFSDSVKVLENNFALALFPEAAHSGKRQMLVHKKAVPRIVWMAEEKANFELDIQIIPAGIYYSSYWKFNRTLIVNFGDPVRVSDYLEEYKKNPGSATISLKNKIFEAIEPLVINIKSKNFYCDFETIREIYGKRFLKHQQQKNTVLNRFKSDQILVRKLDELELKYPEKAGKLVEKTKQFSILLKKYNLRSWLLEESKFAFLKIPVHKIVLLAGLPFFVYGFIFNAIPFFLIDIPVRKRIKDSAFWSTFFLVAGIVLFPIFYLLELWAVSWLLPGIWFKLAFLVSLPFSGKLAFNWYILFRKTVGRIRLLSMKLFKRNAYFELQKQKEAVYNRLDELLTRESQAMCGQS